MNTRAGFAVTKPSIFNLIVSHQVSEFNVWKTYPTATAATFGVLGQSKAGECYAEFGTKSASTSTIYEFCYLPAQYNG